MKIKALVQFSNGTISMEQYEVREVTDTLGNQLIAAGVAIEIGGGTGGGVLVVHDVDETLDKTWQEIYDATFSVIRVKVSDDSWMQFHIVNVGTGVPIGGGDAEYFVGALSEMGNQLYVASSASGYPVLRNNG